MKLHIVKRLLLVILIAVTLITFIACEDEPVKIKLMVISTVKGFTGYYIVNGDTPVPFSATEDAYGIALFEKEIEDVDYLEVSATTFDGATSIEIKVYSDNKKVKSSQKTIEDPYNSYTLNFEYSLGEEEQESSQ
ncbi:MAG: hypothetical protein QHH74_07705 [Spirochaetota bacterium]|nr:hypothetical protein [Spirochaetota bacterium]